MRRAPVLVSIACVTASLTAGCSSGGSSSRSPTTLPSGILAAVCPATIVVQTDWTPEADHSELYQLAAAGGKEDTGTKRYTSELVAHGVDTGVKIEIRAGGPAIGFQQVSAQMYADQSIYLGYVNTDEAIEDSAHQPTVAVVAPRNLDPQIIMWDPALYPQFKTIADIGKTNTRVLYFKGRAYMDYLLGQGILKASQVDGSYDGTPATFVAYGGQAAQQGFATAEPYQYEHEVGPWMKPLKYQLIANTGYSPYAEALAVRAADVQKDSACLSKLVPILQQAQVDYAADPAAANATIVNLANDFNTAARYTTGVAAYAAATQLSLKIIANGSDGVMGSTDTARVQQLMAILGPIYAKQNAPLKTGLAPGDVFTNQFVDGSIHLPAPPPVPSGPAACATSNLALSLGPPNGSAGHSNFEIAFRNTSASACVLSGYPGVSFLDSSGNQIGAAATRSNIPSSPVTVQPGSSGYAHLSVVDPGVVNCPTASTRRIRVFPPGQTVAADLSVNAITVCSAQYPAATIDPITATAL